jgi:S1-C subfamily serine protease
MQLLPFNLTQKQLENYLKQNPKCFSRQKVAERIPAEDAEMTDGDIILEIDNAETRRIEDLVREIHKRKTGDVVRIFALRNGREHFFELKLSETS